MFPNLYSCVKEKFFFSNLYRPDVFTGFVARAGEVEGSPLPSSPHPVLPRPWPCITAVREADQLPVLPRRALSLPRAPAGSFISTPSFASTFWYTFESKLDLFNKIGFLEENVKVPGGRREARGGRPQNCKFWSTALKTHTGAQGR